MRRRTLLALLPAVFLAAHGADPVKPLRIAANPNLSHIELLNNFGPLASALERQLGMPVELVSGRDYDDTLRLLKTGAVDVAGSGAFGYVSANAEFGARLLVRYVEAGGEFYHAVIIVRTESPLRSLKDLRGKRFAFTDEKSTSGYLLPMLALQQQGVELSDLGAVDFVKKQPNAALAVYNRQADAGALADNQLTEKYGIRLDQIRILWRSEPIYHGVWMVRPDMPDPLFKQLQAAMLKVAGEPAVAAGLTRGSVKGFVIGKDSDFDNVRAAKKLLDKLQKSN
ncbi:phosphate/phosphite/phosphonate ABC transporter substrate-binding protein [Chitinimonas lacunae]|uniref:Phosphate/phosphite/phosphonate ABC transporter substrate-binding protein n=1 Tax=Chitinimonas lacunae TaxID=1963018 RepID=A0ABV8MS83_9NEIS